MAAVRHQEGPPTSVSPTTGEGGVAATAWRYDCGRGRSSTYIFDRHGVLANFVTSCHVWRTAAGTRVGMRRREAEQREGKGADVGPCGGGLSIVRQGKASMYVTFTSGASPVRFITVAARNNVLGC